MTLGILRELHRAALTHVSWAESVDAICKSVESTVCLVAARRALSAVELLLIREGANVDG